jgi:quercetin dioxygenase-like cupin family protein
MSDTQSIYSKSHPIEFEDFGSCVVYYMKPGTHEPKHYHSGIEVVYVISGNCQTHKQGKTYTYQPKEIHTVINDSNQELIFVCLTIPPESDSNTIYA